MIDLICSINEQTAAKLSLFEYVTRLFINLVIKSNKLACQVEKYILLVLLTFITIHLSNFNIGGRIGIGLRYHLDDNWAIELEGGGRYTPFPVKDSFVKSQLDMLISAGMNYYILKTKKTAPE